MHSMPRRRGATDDKRWYYLPHSEGNVGAGRSMASTSPRGMLGTTLPPARDYYPAIADAVSKLDSNTAEARQALFERAKSLVVQELRARRPPAKEPEIVRECAAL